MLEGERVDARHEIAVGDFRFGQDLFLIEGRELTGTLAEFVEFYTRPSRQLSLRLA